VTAFFGDFLNWSALQANLLAAAVVLRSVLIGGPFVLFLDSSPWAYRAAAVAPLLDLLLNGAGFVLGFGGPLALGLNAVLDLAIALPAASALLSQSQARLRQRVILDSQAHGPVDFNRRGMAYARQGRWALAVLHFQRALVLDPHVPQYFKDMARAQARLGRYATALGTLREGARRSPGDADFPALIAAIENRK
jgi:tetratricopeptide (TPR) repeat protein